MKKLSYIPIAIVILAGVLSVNTHAQTSSSQRVFANIPFAFNVGNVTLPAGRYTITVLNPSSDRRVLQIRSANGRSSAMIMTTGITANASDDAKLVFDRYGDRYFFSKVQMAGDTTSFAAVKSSTEKAERRVVARTQKKTVVEVTAG
ncbi:MAG TPA: hypothetical protein VFR12_14105 [Pyrinomonadaceae bacterium]|nr:hypothetical protein [Pyrinomonadaceae bacterium]